ncbi:MAG: DoxX family membrane protein [Bacteroidota bacterium]
MNSKVFLVVRIVFGLFLVAFGLDKFLHYVPPPDPASMSEAAMAYLGALADSKTYQMVGVVEVLAGLAFLFNKYGALMAVILMSVSVNAVLYHATLAPATIPGSLILLTLNIVMLYGYRHKYKDLLNG